MMAEKYKGGVKSEDWAEYNVTDKRNPGLFS